MAMLPGADVEARVRQALQQARRARHAANEASNEAYERFESTIQDVVGELIETKHLLEGMLTSSTEYSIIGKDLERRIILWNEGARRNYGYTRDEVLGRTSDFLHAASDLESGYVEHLHRKALEEGVAEGMFRRVRKDGSTFTASVVLTRRLDRHGRPSGYLLISRDVTRDERAMRELKETEALLDNILASSTNYSIIAKDLDRRIVMWNEGARRNYGYEASEVIGKASDFLHDPSDLVSGIVERMHRQALEEGMAEGRFLRRRKDGSTFPASVVITRREDADGRPIGFLLISRDITKDLEAAVAHELAVRKQDELEQMQRESEFKTRFLNLAAHELSTPLTALRLEVDVLARHPWDESAKRKVRVVQRSTERLVSLVADILCATRLQAGRLQLQTENVDVDLLVAQVGDEFQRHAGDAGQTLHLDTESRAKVELDPARFRQVVASLLEASMQSTPPGGSVTLSTRRDGDDVLVSVLDTGRGFDPLERQRILEPFFHAHADAEASLRGATLSLYIAKGLVELHGGRLDLESSGRGHGAKYVVRLPRRQRHQPRPTSMEAGTSLRPTDPPGLSRRGRA